METHGDLRWHVRRVLEQHQRCVVVESEVDLDRATGRAAGSRAVVLMAVPDGPARTAQLLRAMRTLDPYSRPVVLHEVDDASSASVAVRYGARPCPALPTRDRPHDIHAVAALVIDRCNPFHLHCSPDESLRVTRDALELAADGRMVDAMVELSAIDGMDAVIAAVDDLTDRCASLLGRIRRRSRYPIPVDLVMARLQVPSGSDAGVCFTMLERAAFRASGLDVDLDELVLAHESSGVLFGAFHGTHALVRFTGERWWRSPRSVLAETDARRHGALEGGG